MKSKLILNFLFAGTALHLAAYKLDILAIEFFISKGAEVNAKDKHGRTPLHYIHFNEEEYNSVEVAEILILKGADINSKDDEGDTVLHYATNRGFIGVVELLLKKGVEVNIENENNVTPMLNVIDSKNIDIVKLLISHGSDVNYVGKDGYSKSLHWARFNVKMVEVLLASGANVNSLDYLGETLIHYATQGNCTELIELLFKYNVDPDIKNSKNETPLIYAICFKRIEIMKRLINLGVDVNNIDKTSMRTPFNLACTKSFEILQYLLESGADIDEVNKEGLSPLLSVLKRGWAAFVNNVELLVEFLLNYGASVNVLSPFGENVLTIDYRKQCYKVIMQHIAKLLVLDLPVHSSVIDTILIDDHFKSYLEICKEELLTAKNAKLHNCWVTFLNILTDDMRRLVKYSGNQDLVEDFQKTDLVKKFPIYGNTMQKRLIEGLRMRKAYDFAAESLSNILSIFSPTHLIIRDLLDCLNENDLLKLHM